MVGNCNNKMVKDCYILPLRATQPVPEGLLPMSGQGLPLTRPDLLLTIIVRTKRTRAGEVQPPPVQWKGPVSSGLPAVSRPLHSALPPVLQAAPITAGDGSSPYSPAGSSPEIISDSGAAAESADGFSEQLARLQREVAAKRAELAKREEQQQQQARPEPFTPNFQPHSFPPRAGGEPGHGGSTLSRMSADDLLAAAAAMEQQSPSKQSLPPPGPGMPGNLLGQGRGNVDLGMEDDGYGWDRRGGHHGGHRGRGGQGWGDRRGRGGGGGWGDRRGRGGWDRGRERDGDWDRRDDRDWRTRDRRDDRDRGSWRERDRWGGDSFRRDRRDYDRDYDRREPRDYRERERERSRPRHDGRRYEETSRHRGGRENLSGLGTEDWSDDEMRIDSDNSQNTANIHMNVAEEIANFDKQFPPKSAH